MAEVFPPAGLQLGKPDWGFKQTPERNVDIQSLGDGYEFREPVGLNSVRTELSPSWPNLSPEVGLEAYEFLAERLKINTLLWTHPVTGVVMRVIAESVSITWDTFNNAALEVTFRQDFNPG